MVIMNLVESLAQDLRYALRMMRRTPVVTMAAVLSLALGIGANTAIFTVLNSVMLQSLPVKDPSRIVIPSWRANGIASFLKNMEGYSTTDASGNQISPSFSFPVFEQFRRASSVANAVAFAALQNVAFTADGHAEIAQGQAVSGDYYSALGLTPAIGRALTDEDDQAGAVPVCLISYRYWQSRFALDPSVIGKRVALNNSPFTVAGVEPPGFVGLFSDSEPEVTVPIHHIEKVFPRWGEDGRSPFLDSTYWWVQTAVRLKPGVAPERARAELTVLVEQSVAADLEPGAAPPAVILGAPGEGLNAARARERFRDPFAVLSAMVGVVLLIACANVTNLLLARAKSREKETALRLALGAGRGRLTRQLLTESVLLASIGAAFGLILAYWASGVLAAFNNLVIDPRPDGHVLIFTATVSLAAGILFGLAPALRAARGDVQPSIQRHAQPSGFGLARVLVIAQLALSLVVLVGAGLYLRTLHNLRSVNLGMDPRRLLVFRLLPGLAGYSDPRARDFDSRVLAALERVPGVQSAAISRHIPLSGSARTVYINVPGVESPADPRLRNVFVNLANPRFLETMGIPVILGRGIEDRDRAGAPLVAVINETLARTYFPNQSPIGRHFFSNHTQTKAGDYEIVGVVRDSRYNAIRRAPPPTFFMSYLQSDTDGGTMAFEVRTLGDPLTIAQSVRRAIAQIDANVPVFEMSTEEEKIDSMIRQDRLFAGLSMAFGVLALLLAGIGLYGVRAYAVVRRTAEIGIRMALGAGRADIARMILSETGWLTLASAAIGLGAAYALTRYIQAMLFGVAPNDFRTFAAATLILIAIAALAGYLPARRAAKVDPMVALRHD
jgi:predicted permease